jgi:hypothetical protein
VALPEIIMVVHAFVDAAGYTRAINIPNRRKGCFIKKDAY